MNQTKPINILSLEDVLNFTDKIKEETKAVLQKL